MSTSVADNPLNTETTKVDHYADLEAQSGHQGGAGLSRQISARPLFPPPATSYLNSPPLQVQLTSEQFERLYLQPGGQAAKGDLAKRFGNPCVDRLSRCGGLGLTVASLPVQNGTGHPFLRHVSDAVLVSPYGVARRDDDGRCDSSVRLFSLAGGRVRAGFAHAPACLLHSGAYYFIGGIGLTLAGIFEWVLG